ncbi:MAG: magnesium/cobalt transporter CorA [Thermomicrobiales bacterium]
MIKVHVHTSGGHLSETIPLSEISTVIKQDDQLLWIDVKDPSDDDLRLLQEEFGFHPLAIEDVQHAHQRPKVDLYDGYVFLIFYCLNRYERGQPLHVVQLSLFVGANYVVTLHEGEITLFTEIKDRWQRNHEAITGHDAAIMAYTILDAIVDQYFPLIDDLSDEIEDIEEVLFGHFDQRAQKRIFQLKKDLLRIRRVVAPERDVLNILVRRDTPIFSDSAIIYFQDVYDHIIRVTDAIDTYRDLMSSALDSYLSIASNRLNEIMKMLTGWSIILMTVTLIASIYGMNFRHMPELQWHYGYAYVLALMLFLGSGLAIFFRRRNYF